jgi:hypothetical protein
MMTTPQITIAQHTNKGITQQQCHCTKHDVTSSATSQKEHTWMYQWQHTKITTRILLHVTTM